jgi:hypothetical protein
MRSAPQKSVRCAIYTRKSTEYGLEQEFNSLDAQREASEAFVKSQAHEGWRALPPTGMTMAGSLEAVLSALPCSSSSQTSAPARSTW